MLEPIVNVTAETVVKESAFDTVKNVIVDVVKQHPVAAGVTAGVVGTLALSWGYRKLFGKK